MPTAFEYQTQLTLVTAAAVDEAVTFTANLTGSPVLRRRLMLEGVPAVVAYYSDGSAALAADFYDEDRARRSIRGSYTATPLVEDRTVKIRRAVAWASEPFFTGTGDPLARVAELVQPEVADPYRETILSNTHRDPEAAGWRRVAGDSCRFCRMLSDRGAVYRRDTAYFASHPNCDCTAEQVFMGDVIHEASAIQYIASKRNKTARDRARVRDYLDSVYGPE